LATLVIVLLKKAPARSLVLPLLFFLSSLAVPFLPVPTVTDGLCDAVVKRFSREELLEFSARVRSEAGAIGEGRRSIRLDEEYLFDDEPDIFKRLDDEFPNIMAINSLRPRFHVTGVVVVAYYGGALSRHWGYAIVKDDKCPKQNLTEAQCKKAFDNVWVYTDNY
jgi:hypothetical protein